MNGAGGQCTSATGDGSTEDFAICCCANDGTVALLRCSTSPGLLLHDQQKHEVQVKCETALPAETFSSPVLLGNLMILGCRDDHLYCLEWISREAI